jgi:bifunctional non-homologous end joining protein LigD
MRATREYHPARTVKASRPAESISDKGLIPEERNDVSFDIEGRTLRLTNLRKLFWPDLGITKGDLLRYYLEIAPVLLPHLAERAMVMKRYPHGAAGPFFFQKRAPTPRPEWIEVCAIEHASGNIINFPVVRDLPSLLWVINLGCIDLNPWYARCDDVDRPDYLHFDLDPVPPASFNEVLAAARLVHEALDALGIRNVAKTTGSKGIHVYVPIVRGPTQKQVWTFAKEMARSLEKLYPDIVTAEYRVEKRPAGHVLVDYNQDAWGRTLASVYSVRPTPRAAVSAPVTWLEIDRGGIRIEDFRIGNMPDRIRRRGDLWGVLLSPKGRFDLTTLMPHAGNKTHKR